MIERFDVVVVGAGLVGAAISYELAAAGVRTLVLEAEREPAAGASRTNSGVVHTGFDSVPGEFETAMIRAQYARWRDVFDSLEIPYRVTGALLMAIDDEQTSKLPEMAEKAAKNGVEVDLLNKQEAKRLEPRSTAKAGLLVPGESITDPYEVVRRLLASSPNIETRLGWPVEHVKRDGEGALAVGAAGKVAADFVINCAGLFADELAEDMSFHILPRRGEFVVFGKGTADFVNRILLPVPSTQSKGVLVFPTLYGYLCAGPSAEDQEDKHDWRPREHSLTFVKEQAAKMLPEIQDLVQTNSWAGLRPAGSVKNYELGWSERVPAMFHVAAIRSTGLSACLGLSQHVLGELAVRGLELQVGKSDGPVAAPTFGSKPPRPWWERHNELRKVGQA